VVRTALVLGAGLGGMVAAETLRRLLPKSDRVVLVEREAQKRLPSRRQLKTGPPASVNTRERP